MASCVTTPAQSKAIAEACIAEALDGGVGSTSSFAFVNNADGSVTITHDDGDGTVVSGTTGSPSVELFGPGEVLPANAVPIVIDGVTYGPGDTLPADLVGCVMVDEVTGKSFIGGVAGVSVDTSDPCCVKVMEGGSEVARFMTPPDLAAELAARVNQPSTFVVWPAGSTAADIDRIPTVIASIVVPYTGCDVLVDIDAHVQLWHGDQDLGIIYRLMDGPTTVDFNNGRLKQPVQPVGVGETVDPVVLSALVPGGTTLDVTFEVAYVQSFPLVGDVYLSQSFIRPTFKKGCAA